MGINKIYFLLFLGLFFVMFFFDLASGRGILTRRRSQKPKIGMLTILVRKHELLQRQSSRQHVDSDRGLCTGKDCGVKPKQSTNRHRHKHGYSETKGDAADTKDKHDYSETKGHAADTKDKHGYSETKGHAANTKDKHGYRETKKHASDTKDKHGYSETKGHAADTKDKHGYRETKKHASDTKDKHGYSETKGHAADTKDKHGYRETKKHASDTKDKHGYSETKGHAADTKDKHGYRETKKHASDTKDKHGYSETKGHAADTKDKHGYRETKKHASDTKDKHGYSETKGHAADTKDKHGYRETKKHASDTKDKHGYSKTKGHAADTKKKHGNRQTKGHASDTKDKHGYSENKGHAADTKKIHGNRQTKGHAADTKDKHGYRETKKHAADTKDKHGYSETKEDAADTKDKHGYSKTKGHAADTKDKHGYSETKGHAADTKKKHGNRQTKGHAADTKDKHGYSETKGQAADTKKKHGNRKTKGHAADTKDKHGYSETKGHAADTKKKHGYRKTKGHAADTKDKHGYSKTKGHAADTKDKKPKPLPFQQTKEEMTAEDPSASIYNQASYDQYGAGFGRAFPRLQRPPAADRLERRLHPSIRASARQLLNTMDRVLQAMQQHLQQVHDSYDLVFNGTRYVMMTGARDGLQQITTANKEIMDIVLDSHLLTKYIYTRAHNHGMTGPTTHSMDRPHFVSLGIQLAAAIDVERLASHQEDTLHNLMYQCKRVDMRRERVASRMLKFGDKMIFYDLMRNLNMTTRTLLEYDQSLIVQKLARYKGLERLQDILVTAHTQMNVAKERLRRAANNFRGNRVVYADWKIHRQGSHGIAPVSLTIRQRREASNLTDIDITKRQAIRSQVRQHIVDVNRVTHHIQRIFHSLISTAKRIIRQGGKGKSGVTMAILESKLQDYIKNMNIAMDRIRLAIDDQSELRQRCEELEVGSGDSGESPIDCETFIEEGSGTDEKTTISAPDTDFEFIGETVVDGKKVTSSARLADKVDAYVKDLLTKCTASVSKAKDVAKTVEDESSVLGKIRNSINVADNYVLVAKEFTSSYGTTLGDAQSMDNRAQSLFEKIRTLANVTRIRTAAAVLKAENKKNEMKSGRSGKPVSGSDGGGDGGSDDQGRATLTDAIELTSRAKNNIGSIVSLRREIPVTCGSVKQRVYDIRSNISHLRQKVQRARLVLSTLQISISKTEAGYVPIPLKSTETSKSLVTSMEVCIRPQTMDGDILILLGNKSQSHVLNLNGGYLSYTVYVEETREQKAIKTKEQLSSNTWYSVITKRLGHALSLSVISEDGKTVENVEDKYDKIKSVEPPPLSVFVGGAPDDVHMSLSSYVWKGCVGGVRINGQSLGLMQNGSDGKSPKPCNSSCSSSVGTLSMVFEGNGLLHFPTSILKRRPVQTVLFEFRTHQADVLLMNMAVTQQRFLSTVKLEAGAIVITIPTSGIRLRSRNTAYNDGVFHKLKITYTNRSPQAEVDNGKTFSTERMALQRIQDDADGLYVGGKPLASSLQQKQDERWLMGCVRSLQLNGKLLLISDAATSTGVYAGRCNSSSVWRDCVEFGDGSDVLSYEDRADGNSVLLAVEKTGRGLLLNYQKHEKYNIEIEVTNGSIEVSRTDKDLTASLEIPDDFSDHFIFVNVKDSGAEVSVSAMGQLLKFDYGSGFFSWGGTADNTPQSITIAGISDDISRRFYGGISQLIIGSQYIDLHQFRSSNKLSSCSRQHESVTSSVREVIDELVIEC